MKKNTASQVIGAQMVSATDGSAFTGSVTCSVTGDGGTQATGSVGSGACTHEGNGFHTYAPAQAETNYDHVAFTFTGTGAVPVTVQCYPSFPQTGDGFARLGAPAGASVSADIAAVKADTAAILTDTGTTLDGKIDSILADTNELQGDWANGGRLDLILDARASQTSVDDLPTNAELATALGTADDAVLTQVALVKAKTDNLPADPADASDIASAFGTVNSTLATIAGYIDTEVAALATTLGTPAGASVSADIAAVKAETASILTDTAEIGAAGAGLTVLATAAALATVDGNVDSILADTADMQPKLGTPAGASVSADIAAVKAQTADIETDTQDLQSRVPAALTAGGNIKADALALNGDTTSAANIAKTTRAIARGTVTTGGTTTSIPTSAFSPSGAVSDQFKGRIVTFDADTTTAALRGQSTDITASSNSATPTLTVTALTTAPASGDTFSVT